MNLKSDLKTLDRRYRRPPVIEALCEIYFAESDWDGTIPGRFYERVKVNFPKKQQREIQRAEVAIGPTKAQAGVRSLAPRIQFVSDEKRRMIQIAQDLLVVNQLAPYPRFEDWESEVHHALNIYNELANPMKIERIGLRYINRVVIPGERVQMEEYFTIYPNLPPGLGDVHGSFLIRVEVPQTENGHTVLITFGSSPPRESQPPEQIFLLDLYDVIHIGKLFEELDIKEEIGKAHDNVVTAFEGGITDHLRETIGLEESP